jgi:hypothetical protein
MTGVAATNGEVVGGRTIKELMKWGSIRKSGRYWVVVACASPPQKSGSRGQGSSKKFDAPGTQKITPTPATYPRPVPSLTKPPSGSSQVNTFPTPTSLIFLPPSFIEETDKALGQFTVLTTTSRHG